MLGPRVIPCLLIHDHGLVKTKKFSNPVYVGDPINAVRIFNEKESDEIIVLDIDATANQSEPNYKLIEKLASECQMPLCYGGGVKSTHQAKKISELGVEKVAVSSLFVDNPHEVEAISKEIGKQSTVVVFDIKKRLLSSTYEVWTHNGTKNSKIKLLDAVNRAQNLGVGEIVLNFIDQDGTMSGIPSDVVAAVKQTVHIPMTVMGGISSLDEMGEIANQNGIIGIAAGALFVFKGPYRAVLINYPEPAVKLEKIYGRCNVYK